MILAAHQPAYLPWLGYLHKLACCDVFVIVDDVQYEAQNFQNRNRLKINNGVAWVTVPLEHGPQGDRICDKVISYRQSPREAWQRLHAPHVVGDRLRHRRIFPERHDVYPENHPAHREK